MTPTDLASRALSHVDRHGAVELDPITLTILLAVLGAVITHYVEKCLDRIDHKTVTSPSIVQRGRLWLDCLWAARRHGGTRETATQAYEALLKTGAGMSHQDLVDLRAAS